jgi:hypothetical protein
LTRVERKGILRQGEAAILLADILSTPPDFHPVRPLLPRAVDISSQMRVGADVITHPGHAHAAQ